MRFDRFFKVNSKTHQVLGRAMPNKRFIGHQKQDRKNVVVYVPPIPPVDKEVFKQEFVEDEWLSEKDKKSYENKKY